MSTGKKPRIALVHDFLVQDGGAEQVLRVLASMFPEAPIYTLIADYKKAAGTFDKNRIRTSFLQKYPFSIKKYQWYLPLMPRAIEAFDFDEYDIVISSASAFAKGVITGSQTLHICYCHTPTRYLWTDTHSYIQALRVPYVLKKLLPILIAKLRNWDYQAAQRPDAFVANSKTVERRIKKYYRRNSKIIYPPVPVEMFQVQSKKENYFLAGGRIVAYKRFDIVVEAFNRLKIPIKIFGTGPLLNELKNKAKSNIEFLGWTDDASVKNLYASAKCFINPQEEDFGITMVEALASGCPVIAYNKGGAAEIVKDGVSGTLFDEQTWESLANSVIRLREKEFDYSLIQSNAKQFSEKSFREKILNIIHEHRETSSNRS
jgi:glycosyltransferase involved in cell wall biosynthesis